jgi:hypothetical protein
LLWINPRAAAIGWRDKSHMHLIPINMARAGRCQMAEAREGHHMIGITLSSEQIRQAPLEVRQWIEREVASSLGLQIKPSSDEPKSEHLASCSAGEVAAILSAIQSVLPAVNVLFEFGREGTPVAQAQLKAFRLLDIAHHTRLPDVKQVLACINMINEALAQARGDNSASFCGFDREGHCYVAAETQQNIRRLWQSVVAGRQSAPDAVAQSAPASAAPASTLSGSVGGHLGNILQGNEVAGQV